MSQKGGISKQWIMTHESLEQITLQRSGQWDDMCVANMCQSLFPARLQLWEPAYYCPVKLRSLNCSCGQRASVIGNRTPDDLHLDCTPSPSSTTTTTHHPSPATTPLSTVRPILSQPASTGRVAGQPALAAVPLSTATRARSPVQQTNRATDWHHHHYPCLH